jgi:Tetracyclin repressor-like, C-terminal domain
VRPVATAAGRGAGEPVELAAPSHSVGVDALATGLHTDAMPACHGHDLWKDLLERPAGRHARREVREELASPVPSGHPQEPCGLAEHLERECGLAGNGDQGSWGQVDLSVLEADSQTPLEDSTSNYFRTRAALLSGVVARIVERELPPIDAALSLTSASELVDTFCGFFEYATSINRVLTTARLVLFMEGAHNSAIREDLSRGRAAMMSPIVPALARLGAHDPQAAANALAACFEGLVLHHIARHDDTDPRPTFKLIVKAALS